MITFETARTVILGVAASDAHAVANQLIDRHLRAHGFTVMNLGVCTPLTEFADALDDEPGAEAVLIGSLNGHAYEDLHDLPTLRGRGRLRRPVILGGNLSLGAHKQSADLDRLHRLGVDHILQDVAALVPLLDMLRTARVPVAHGV
ncbi:cobalamin-dependent protein [Actinoplanes utahensis]|uniref:Methylaspartate mutase n=1 Tax=Actinoplanes utahensis TaxID=1869 RepID=A0A0A6USC8_ACTUT|nr:cobalamin-dependent protein [Actinoplanes utahensis]KHD77893.1 methylaspartate mutase [Actinoplanes utahensis]GIF32404.1 methylaspartate mutase [Actinoplanes utahensis]